MKPRVVPTLAALLLATACAADPPSDGDPDPDPDPAETVAYEALIGEVAAVYCERVFACCLADERALIGILPYTDERPDIPDVAACTAHMTGYLGEQGRIAAHASLVADGSITYDGGAAAGCLADFAAMSCEEFGHAFDAVRNMAACSPYAVDKAAGDECAIDDQCATGYCAQAAEGDQVLRCIDKPGDGDFCPVGVCADGLYCSFTDGNCHPILANGADCTFDDDCSSGFCSYELSKGDTGLCSVPGEWVCDGP